MACNSFTISELFIALASNNVEQQVEFYTALLQTEPNVTTPNYAEFRAYHLKIAIFKPNADNVAEFESASSGAMSFCLEVDDLENVIARLTNLGYSLPGKIMKTSHGQEIYAYDPDGNRLILHQSP
ncbi:MAG: VOC family protein [Cyanobacteria bacterium J06649_4]